jgi:hypothetical protein
VYQTICSLLGADHDTITILVAVKIRNRPSVTKKGRKWFDMNRFLSQDAKNNVEVKEDSQVKISNRFAILRNLDADEEFHFLGYNIA